MCDAKTHTNFFKDPTKRIRTFFQKWFECKLHESRRLFDSKHALLSFSLSICVMSCDQVQTQITNCAVEFRANFFDARVRHFKKIISRLVHCIDTSIWCVRFVAQSFRTELFITKSWTDFSSTKEVRGWETEVLSRKHGFSKKQFNIYIFDVSGSQMSECIEQSLQRAVCYVLRGYQTITWFVVTSRRQ